MSAVPCSRPGCVISTVTVSVPFAGDELDMLPSVSDVV